MKITAILGTYHRTGMIDSAVEEILSAAAAHGRQVRKIHLLDCHIEFCRNCQECTQQPGEARGRCPIGDDMAGLLEEIESSDAIVLASPMNFGTVTALMKRFIERLVCYAYWPWDRPGPQTRRRDSNKRAIIVASCAAPAIMGRYMTSMAKLLKQAARLLGAGKVRTLFIGMARHTPTSDLSPSVRARAARLGRELAG